MADIRKSKADEDNPAPCFRGELIAFATAIAMALLFYGLVTPVALLLRAFGRDPLRLRFDPGADSYWIRRPPGRDRPPSMRSQS